MAITIKSGVTSDGIILTDEHLVVESGATVNRLRIKSSGWLFLGSGGTATHTTVNSDGRVFLYGYSDHATINSGGRMDVSSGASADGTVLTKDGELVVNQGGLVRKTTVSSFGRMYVVVSGTASDTTIGSGGLLQILESGFADATTVNPGGSLVVSPGAKVHNTTVNNKGRFHVSSGGTAYITEIDRGGSFFVDGGATAFSILENGGYVSIGEGAEVSFRKNSLSGLVLSELQSATLHSGTTANGTTVNSGRLEVFSGGRANSTTVHSGYLEVFSGGAANGVTAEAGGSLSVASGGAADGVTVEAGGSLSVASGGTAFSILEKGGYVDIREGADVSFQKNSFSGLVLNNYQSAALHSGTTANITAVNSGYLEVFSGGTANSTTVESDGKFFVFSGGVANGITVNGGWFVVSGGVAIDTTVNSGGEFRVSCGGVANGATVNSGWITVFSGGTANHVTVKSGGVLTVSSGGMVSDIVWTPCEGHIVVSDGGYASFASRYSGVYYGSGGKLLSHAAVMEDIMLDFSGEMFVMSDGVVDGATVNPGGELRVSGGTANRATILFDARMEVARNGTANSAAVCSGGTMFVSGDGVANETTVKSGGCVCIWQDGMANGATVESCGDLEVRSGGTANLATVNSDGWLVVSCGGVANGVTVNDGGILLVSSGGMALNIDWTPCEGRVDVSDGGYVTFVSRYSGVYFGSDNKLLSHADVLDGDTIGSSGEMFVMNGGVANGATVNSDGWIDVSSGGAANGATVNAGGVLFVFRGGVANNATVNSDGRFVVSSGGVANGATVNSGGELDVSGGAANGTVNAGDLFVCGDAAVNDTTVNAGGRMFVDSGVVANGVTVRDQAALHISGGATATGKMVFEGGAVVSMCDGSIFNFDLAQISADGGALVSDLSIVQGTPLYTLTLDGTEADGDYKLAMNASGFESVISVRNTAGDQLGTLTVGGGIQTVGGVDYALTVGADNVLTLTVGAVEPLPPFTTKSDIDGNGISDVMFVWTGNDYRHGFWKNGTSTWQCLDSEHPSNWDNLGCYDMTGDGRADSVLVGNVVMNGVGGAYIGYYSDGIDNPDGSSWVTIGYLHNANDLTWKNKVGNLTGSEGRNSIVWYTPQLGMLGAWIDGTQTWVSIASGFDATWSLIGCGDFDGDGRDQIVMSRNFGAEYYAVDIDGQWTDIGLSDSGWEIRAIGDFAGDGKADIVAFHKETGLVALWDDGKSANWSQLCQLDASDWFVVGAGDYDGDRKDDLLVRQYSTGMLGYYSSCDIARWNVLGYGVDMSWTVIA